MKSLISKAQIDKFKATTKGIFEKIKKSGIIDKTKAGAKKGVGLISEQVTKMAKKEAKPAETKPAETKPTEAQPTETKPPEPPKEPPKE